MNAIDKFLSFTPKQYLCPFCGEWHTWPYFYPRPLRYYGVDEPVELHCQKDSSNINFYFEFGNCYYLIERYHNYDITRHRGKISIEDIISNLSEDEVTFTVSFTPTCCWVELKCCLTCSFYNVCQLRKLDHVDSHSKLKIELGFKFSESECESLANYQIDIKEKKLSQLKESLDSKEQELNNRENALKSKEQELNHRENVLDSREQQLKQQGNKEEATMTKMVTKKTTIWEQLYEHSPKENMDIVKKWAEKYKPTLKWALPVVSIYTAYRILNSKDSKLTVDNINEECKKKIGLNLDFLKDKNALNELMVIGGMSAGAYATVKAISAIYEKSNEEGLAVEQIEDGLDKLDGARKKFGWIQPKTEAMLPVAVSVIIVYVMTQKPAWFEDIKTKVSKLGGKFSCRTKVYMEMAKLFVADKLKIDLENEEEVQKMKIFAILAGIVGVSVFLYGRKMLGDNAILKDEDKVEKNEKLETFMSQVIAIMKKLMPTAFVGITTFLISREVLKPDETINAECVEITKEIQSNQTEISPEEHIKDSESNQSEQQQE